MQFSDDLEFDHRGREEVYEHVERHGHVEYGEARAALGMGPGEFGHHVTVLERDGVLEREGDTLRVAFEGAGPEYHETDVEFVIRQARQEDLSAIVAVIREALADDTYIVGETLGDVVDHEKVLLRRNELQSRIVFVATVEGRPVGWVHLDRPERSALSHTATLTLGVHDEYRDHGIGARLLARGQRWAGEVGTEKLYNSVPATNEGAIAFLKAHGWTTEAVREDHYRINGAYVDEVMLAHHL